jgi:hypothetical protein
MSSGNDGAAPAAASSSSNSAGGGHHGAAAEHEDERLTRAVQVVRAMDNANLKEQCLRTEWAALQTDLERDLLCKVVGDRAFWDEVKEVADEDMLDSNVEADDAVDVDQRMLQMFKVFDKDGSGSIDANEFHQMLLYMGIPLSDGEVREMIAGVDADQDGAINDREFLHVMKVTLPQKTQASGGGGGVVPAVAAGAGNMQRNMDAQREIRAVNADRSDLARRTSDAALDQ